MPRRFGQVIKLKPGAYDTYKEYHANVWPEVLETIHACNIRDYSIYHHDGLLFASFKYIGDDYEADMKKMASDPKTREWWTIMDPLQASRDGHDQASNGPWWKEAEEMFYFP
ncbi:hypothetical protein BZG36_01870 [Bifiguratus adelaidae]|uniref:L-rhamnose mutarotase n=1 Tax=Bifiguratus adelaidae TaxID=1938954 RepID=A0A261Y2D9_9FUNG|nr:hypothetical protein BZG36_01870 [Bifiguratus adelaidae]